MKIPKNLKECFVALTKATSDEDREKFMLMPEKEVCGFHFFPGMRIRNEWGLWNGSMLAKYFNRLGVYHADDMSGMILESYWRHLNGLPLKLREQARGYHDYWIEQGVDPKTFKYDATKHSV